MTGQGQLFAPAREALIHEIDAEIARLLFGGNGPLGFAPTADEKAVLGMIRYRRGWQNAVKVREVQERTKLDVRSIKEAVRTLRLSFHLPIGSSKHAANGGYYVMITAEDRAIWRRDVIDQARAQFEVLRAADGHQATLEALGQLRAELEQLNG